MRSNAVSVVVPTYNRAAFLAECLESLLAQTVPPVRILVIDDGSTDNTSEVVATFGDRVEYLRKENGGKASALNLALPMIDTEFVWFFDDDDVAHPWAIESHLSLLAAHSNLGFTFGFHDLGRTGADGRIVVTTPPSPPPIFEAPLAQQRLNLMRFCAFMLTGCIIRTRLFEHGLRFRETLLRSQDYAVLIELSQLADFAFTGSRTYIFRQHEGARGPASAVHAHADKRRAWMKYDRMIGDLIVKQLPLERFQPEYSQHPGSAEHRAALIRRAWVLASKADVGQVVRDLKSATSVCSTEALSAEDINFIETLPSHPYFLLALSDQPHAFLPLLALANTPAGRATLGSLSKGFYRQLKLEPTAAQGRVRAVVAACMLAFLPFAARSYRGGTSTR
ncbi:hypothetical protein dqs_3397 [Azoarcus olearius]|nr:hypothetical protein dqs_3397 [Azoarcus olearius]